jgi:2-octaprenyl-6-methoxyphenol hydroxylase
MTDTRTAVDIAIVGAGPVGMTLALALAGGPYSVRLIDRRRAAPGRRPARPGAGARQPAAARTPATPGMRRGNRRSTIHVSQRAGFGRTLIDAADYGIPALGYVMRYRDLAATLDRRLGDSQLLDRLHGRAANAATAARRDLTLACAARRAPRGPSRRPCRGQRPVTTPTSGCAIIASTPSSPKSRQRRTTLVAPGSASRPTARSPCCRWRRTTRWCSPHRPRKPGALATRRGRLSRRAAQSASAAASISSRAARGAGFPLALRVRRQLTGQRQVWIGNAAQTLHPVSGQGFNLGLRDAWELAETCSRGRRRRRRRHAGRLLPPPPDRPQRQHGVHRRHRARLFERSRALRVARGLGLLGLDLLPPLRHFVARRMIWGARAWP